jgi:hypothetical protein
VNSMFETVVFVRIPNVFATAELRFDNGVEPCNHPHPQGRSELTIAGSIVGMRCRGHCPAPWDSRTSITPIASSFAGKLVAPHPPFSNSEWLRHAQVLSKWVRAKRGSSDAPHHMCFLYYKVLRFWHKGQRSSPQPARINSGFHFGNLLVAKGDTLIHGPRLVAQSVGSEWRNHHLHQVIIHTI